MKFGQSVRTLLGKLPRVGNDLQWATESEVSPIASTGEAGVIQSLCYSDLNYTSTNRFVGFRSYVSMVNIAYHLGCTNVLEIGAGLSTAVWAHFAQRTGAQVCVIDMDFGSMKSFLGDSNHAALVKENVEFIEGATITADELLDFYTVARETFGGVEVAAFADKLDLFKKLDCITLECQEVLAFAPRKKWSVRELIVNGSSLVFPRQLLDIFSSGKSFDNEMALLKNVESRGKAGVLDELIARGNQWDLVFFDSGELSSMLEWVKLKDKIAVGGVAAFHDIFFPKSFKNFIVCASVLADPDWKVVFIDDSTHQGLMIAQKLH